MRVSDVLELLSHGATIEEVLRDYPSLQREDMLAAMAYAATQANQSVIRHA